MKSILVFFVVALCACMAFGIDADTDDQSRIINGTLATIKQHPYQLSFRFRGRHICGAVIISKTRGLTAAHCYNRQHNIKSYSILAGVSNLTNEQNGQVRPLTKLIQHPHYNLHRRTHDIAVLWFETPFAFSDKIAAIRLPKPGDSVKQTGIIAGWGLTRPNDLTSISDQLRRTEKNMITIELCDSLYTGIISITFGMFCTLDTGGNYDACRGDEGGAYASGGYIYGIISWGYRCAHPRFPRVYTRVPFYVDWIKRNANLTSVPIQ